MSHTPGIPWVEQLAYHFLSGSIVNPNSRPLNPRRQLFIIICTTISGPSSFWKKTKVTSQKIIRNQWTAPFWMKPLTFPNTLKEKNRNSDIATSIIFWLQLISYFYWSLKFWIANITFASIDYEIFGKINKLFEKCCISGQYAFSQMTTSSRKGLFTHFSWEVYL